MARRAPTAFLWPSGPRRRQRALTPAAERSGRAPQRQQWRGGTQPASGQQVPDPADTSPEAAASRAELIGEFAAHGLSSAQIGKRLSIGEERVRQVAREHGITIRADTVLGRTRRPDSTRIVRETVHALEGPMIDGISLLCQRYDGDLSEHRAVQRLSSAHGGVSGLVSRAGQLRQSTGSATAQCVAAAAVEVINRGTGGRKLPGWWRNEA